MAEINFSSLPSNRSNLVNWHRVTSGSMTLTGNLLEKTFCFDETFERSEFSRPYPKVRHTYELPLIVGQKVSFFTNFLDPSEIPQNASVRVFENKDGGAEKTALFTVNKTNLESGNIYVEITPLSGVRDYESLRIVLFDSTVSHISRPFVIVPNFSNVFRIQFNPQKSVYFNYPYLDPTAADLFQSILVHGNLVEVTFPGETEIYREVTTNRERQETSYIGRRLNIETYYMDLLAHEAMAAIFFHKGVKINDLDVTIAGSYEPNMVSDREISKGSVELIDLGYGHRIKSC